MLRLPVLNFVEGVPHEIYTLKANVASIRNYYVKELKVAMLLCIITLIITLLKCRCI